MSHTKYYIDRSFRRHVLCYCISKTRNEFGQNPEENIIWTGPGLYTVISTGSLTKTNKENVNAKYNILKYLRRKVWRYQRGNQNRRTDNTMAKRYQRGNQNPYFEEEQTTRSYKSGDKS